MLAQPTPGYNYLTMPVVGGVCAGLGAALVLSAFGANAEASVKFGLGIAFVGGVNFALFAIDKIGTERARYWEYRREVAAGHTSLPLPEPEVDTYREVRLPTGKRAWISDATPTRLQNAYNAQPGTIATIALERDADDPVHDQTELIDVSWGLWTIAHNRDRVQGWTEEAWKRARVFSSLSHYTATRDYMISRHLLRWRNPARHRVGVELTRAGECVMDTLARKDKPPSPVHVPVRGELPGL